jgi:Predicted membrane protein
MQARYGETFELAKARTSVIPFWAILQGRQTIKLEEFVRPAYLGVLVFILLLWWAHPLLIQATGKVNL